VKDMKVAVRSDKGTKFLPLSADDEWVKKHETKDEAEAVALATLEAQRGLELYTQVMGGRKAPVSVRLTTSIPDGSMPLLNDEITKDAAGLSCFICLCDSSTPPNCVCTPC
jgi:hypothetical protein